MTKPTETRDISFNKLTPVSILMLSFFLLFSFYLLWVYIQPFKAERYFRDGYNLGVSKRYKYAIEELEKTKLYAPWESHYQVQLAKYYEEYGKQQTDPAEKIRFFKKAEATYKHIIVLDDQNPWFRNRLALTYTQLKDIDKENAAKYEKLSGDNIRIGAELDKKNPLFQLNYASYLHKTDRLQEAKEYYKKVIDYDNRFGEAYYNIADIYRQEKNLDKTVYYYNELYKINPNFKNIDLALASTYIILDNKDKAITHLEHVINKNPKQFDPLRSLAALYHQKKEWVKAAATYKLILQHFPEKQELHPYYIQALVNAARFKLAILELEAFIKKNPNNTAAKVQLKKIQAFIKKALEVHSNQSKSSTVK